MDTMTYLSKIWLKYLDGKATIGEVVAEYEKNGFDACQDIPGNYHWKELYDHLGPDTKVILTVRDNTERWWNSYVNFFTQETELGFQNSNAHTGFSNYVRAPEMASIFGIWRLHFHASKNKSKWLIFF